MGEALRRLRVLGFIALCLLGAAQAAWHAWHWGDGLSPVDPFSEANAIREAEGFRAKGLWHDAGLGNVLLGPRYPQDGFVAVTGDDLERSVTPGGVYTHYPPGPAYLLHAAMALLGPEPVARLRVLPLAVSAAAAVFLGLSIRRRFGAVAGWLAMGLAALAVPLHDVSSSIYFTGYALALLLVGLGIGIGRNTVRAPFLLLGFIQGWLSFDYAFLVALSPLAVELALPCISPGHRPRLRLALERCALAGGGFAFAHGLHLAQVWAFHGSLAGAIADIGGSARYRAGMEQPVGVAQFLQGAWDQWRFYVWSPHPVSLPALQHPEAPYVVRSFRVLGLTLGAWWPLAAVALAGVDAWRWARGRRPAWLLARWCGVGVIGLALSSGWWVLMQNHAAKHEHLLYRHLGLCFLLWALFLAVQAAGPVERWQARRRAAQGAAD